MNNLSIGGYRSLLARSFLPYAARFLYRHPKKISELRGYWRGYSRRYQKIASLTDKTIEDAEEILYELECQEPHFRELNGLSGVPMHHIVGYTAVRLMRPDVVVETGVAYGLSSWFILLALQHNSHGVLHSVDLPNQDVELIPGGHRQTEFLPEGEEVGFMVPQGLRARWRLHLGDAREVLPKLLPALGSIDIFLHDSLHTYDHMLFEYRTAWTHLREGGILLSDDTDLNTALPDFADQVRCPYVVFDFRPRAGGAGAIRKPVRPENTRQ